MGPLRRAIEAAPVHRDQRALLREGERLPRLAPQAEETGQLLAERGQALDPAAIFDTTGPRAEALGHLGEGSGQQDKCRGHSRDGVPLQAQEALRGDQAPDVPQTRLDQE